MRRTKKSAADKAASQDVKSVQVDIAAIKKRTKDLLAKAGRDIRSVRHDVSALKKVGLVSKRINAGSYQPTRYMLKKIAKNADVLSGKVIALPAPKKVREKYNSKGVFESRGPVLIVPREYANQKTRIRKGVVEISRPLKRGEEIRIVLPFKAVDMEQVAEGLIADPTMGGIRSEGEAFGFRLFGHNMQTFGFPDVAELGEYIKVHYQHLFSGREGKQGVKHFELLKFRAGKDDTQLNESNPHGRIYNRRKIDASGRNTGRDTYREKKLERDAHRKHAAREKETNEQRKARLDYARIKSAQRRQRKFLDD